MRRFLAVWLPPLAGFGLYYLAMRLDPQYGGLRMDEIGEGTLNGLIAYYRFFMPLLFLVGLLTQYLLILPAWDRVQRSRSNGRMLAALVLVVICVLLAAALAYAVWDPDSPRSALTRLWAEMTAVQLLYWAINVAVLCILKENAAEPAEKGAHP